MNQGSKEIKIPISKIRGLNDVVKDFNVEIKTESISDDFKRNSDLHEDVNLSKSLMDDDLVFESFDDKILKFNLYNFVNLINKSNLEDLDLKKYDIHVSGKLIMNLINSNLDKSNNESDDLIPSNSIVPNSLLMKVALGGVIILLILLILKNV